MDNGFDFEIDRDDVFNFDEEITQEDIDYYEEVEREILMSRQAQEEYYNGWEDLYMD